MNNAKILIIDNKCSICNAIKIISEYEGWKIYVASNGNEALRLINEKYLNLFILDLISPDIDGIDLLCEIKKYSSIPIIVISDLNDEEIKIKCLKSGIEDYFIKPFNLEDLIIRIKILLRYNHLEGDILPSKYYIDTGIEIDFEKMHLRVSGSKKRLTPIEYKILHELIIHEGRVLTYQHFLKNVWGPEYGDERQYLHVYMGKLRNKIEPDPQNPKYLINIPGMGYMFQKQNN